QISFFFPLLFRMMSDYTVETTNDGLTEFNVEFHGPKQSMSGSICLDVINQSWSPMFAEYCERYAKREKLEDVSDGSDEDISDDEVTGSDNVDIAGDADP
ncbi:hypothetical protein BHM03_00008671, partial [Ensete ventricosum]